MGSSKFDNLYLHVGRHKTGTSALQKFFLINEKVLLKNGIVYPAVKRNRFSGAHHVFFPIHPRKSGNSQRSDFDKNIDALQPLAQEGMNLLLSTETLSEFRDYSPLSELKRIASRVKIVIYLRRQDAYAESVYSQVIKSGKFSGGIDELVMRGNWHEKVNYKKNCDQWADVFGKENIIVRPYERGQFKDGGLFSDFLAVLGVESLDSFVIPKRYINPSLTQDSLHFKRYANKLIVDDFLKNELQKPLMALQKGKGKPFQNHSLLSPADKLELLKKFKESNALVAREYLNREDNCLFYDPPPQMESAWSPYKGLDKDIILDIAKYVSVETPALFAALVAGIQDGLKSEDIEVSNAAKKLKLILDIIPASEVNTKANPAKRKRQIIRMRLSYYLTACLKDVKKCYGLFIERVKMHLLFRKS